MKNLLLTAALSLYAISASAQMSTGGGLSIPSGSAGQYNIGTSGATVPLLNGTNTWSGTNTYSGQSVLNGGIGQVGTTFSSSSYTHNTLYLAPIVTGAGSGSYNTLVASIQYNSASDTSGAVNAFQVSGQLFAQGGANQTTGIRAEAKSLANGGAYGASQSLYGGLFSAYTEGTSSFNHVIGIKVNPPANNGNVTYQSGLYVSNQENTLAATITDSDAIHIEGKSGTDTARNGICYGNGTSSTNACIFSDVTNSVTVDATAGVKTQGVISNGTKFTASGCSNSATVGGATAGRFTSGTTGACTVTITMNGATGLTAPNGWACSASNQTTANLMRQTASTTTTATISGTTNTNDVIVFNCIGY